MPTYDYRCDACGHEMDLFQSFSESAKRKCPACGKLKLKRLIGTGGGIIFKGSGFYQTDYRSDSYKKGEEVEKKGAEKSAEKAADKQASKDGDKNAKKSEGSSDASPSKAKTKKPDANGASD